MSRCLLHRCVAITVVVLPLLFATAVAQRNNKEIPVKELLSLPGKVVSEAKSARPTTESFR